MQTEVRTTVMQQPLFERIRVAARRHHNYGGQIAFPAIGQDAIAPGCDHIFPGIA